LLLVLLLPRPVSGEEFLEVLPAAQGVEVLVPLHVGGVLDGKSVSVHFSALENELT
jgi:hypothetical protein